MIFIVDDDLSVRRGVARLLRSAGFEVEAFTSAREFLERERFDGPSCLVLDVRMEGMDGLDLQEELNARGLTLPIIFITGHGDIPMSIQAMKAGAADFLPQPFDDNALLATVRRALKKDALEHRERVELAGIKERIATLTPREYEVFTYVITDLLNKRWNIWNSGDTILNSVIICLKIAELSMVSPELDAEREYAYDRESHVGKLDKEDE